MFLKLGLFVGDVRSALSMTNDLLKMSPNHERALGNKVYYEKELNKANSKSMLRGDDGTDEVPKDETVVCH